MSQSGTPTQRPVDIRAEWPQLVAHACQLLALEISRGDILMVRPASVHFAVGLPEPRSVVERLLLRDQLIDVALRWGTEVHRAFHRRHPKGCTFSPADAVLESWKDRAADPRDAFGSWASRFVDQFERAHVPPLAARVRAYVEAHYAEAVDIQTMARALHCTRARAAGEFRKAYGMSPRSYQRQLRIWEGFRLLRGTNLKIEAVARSVGYRSKKNFYQVTRDVTGGTPTQLRRRK